MGLGVGRGPGRSLGEGPPTRRGRGRRAPQQQPRPHPCADSCTGEGGGERASRAPGGAARDAEGAARSPRAAGWGKSSAVQVFGAGELGDFGDGRQ